MTIQEEMVDELIDMARKFKHANKPMTSAAFVRNVLKYQVSKGVVIAKGKVFANSADGPLYIPITAYEPLIEVKDG